MTERARYVAVGLTVLIALGLLAAMTLLFAGWSEFFQRGYEIEVRTSSTSGAEEGDFVHLGGLKVGRVTRIAFTDPDDPMEGITLTARIKPNIRVPANVICYLTRNTLTGSVYIELYPDGEALRDPQTGQPIRFLPTDRVSVVPGKPKSYDPAEALEPMMKIFTELADKLVDSFDKLGRLADTLNELLSGDQEPPPATAATGPSATQPAIPAAPSGLRGVLARLNRTLDTANEAMAAFRQFSLDARKTTAQADKTLKGAARLVDSADQRIEELTKKLIEDAESISKLVTTINQLAARIESGKGSAGKFINDAELYNNLLEASKQAKTLMKELSQLLKQWKDKGVKVELK